MPLISGIDGCFVPGTLFFLLLSDTNLCAEKFFSLFHARSILLTGIWAGTAKERGIHSGVGTESNLGSYKFLVY